MKILIIGGTHGNEPLGPSIVRAIKRKPVKDIDIIIGNNRALKANKRFTEADLNRSFPGSDASKVFEERRAAELLLLCKQYDLVLDFHNTHFPENDCSFIGQTANKNLLSVSTYFDLKRVVIADYNCINKFAPNCISLEVSLDSKLMDIQWWYDKIKALPSYQLSQTANNIEEFKFVHRITKEESTKYQLERYKWRAFQAIDENLALSLGVSSPAFPIFISDSYTPDYFGGLLNKIS